MNVGRSPKRKAWAMDLIYGKSCVTSVLTYFQLTEQFSNYRRKFMFIGGKRGKHRAAYRARRYLIGSYKKTLMFRLASAR